MSRLIDAARQTRADDEASVCQIARDALREFQADAGGVARADNADHRAHLGLVCAAHAEQGCTFGFFKGANPSGAARAAAPCQFRQALECGSGTAAMIDERTEGARPDIVGSDQPQAVDPLGLGQRRR